MNLDSLSLALSEISYSVANLTKKNFKSSVAEINHLVTHHGAEAERHLFRCLFSYVDFSGDGKSSGKDFHQTQLLIQELSSLISKVNLVSILCYSIDYPLHLQKSLKPSSQLFPQISKVLKLSRVQDVIFGLALLSSSNPDIKNYAAQFVKQKLPDLIRSYVDPDSSVNQEGGLQDVAIEAIHLLLTHLAKDQFGIGQDQKEAFLAALRKDFPSGRVPVVLRPLLYPDLEELSLDKIPDSSLLLKNIMEKSLADILSEAGIGSTSTVEECRNTLMQLNIRDLTPTCVARVLSMMIRNTKESRVVKNELFGGGIWSNPKEKPDGDDREGWNVEVFVQVVQDLAPHLNWRDVVSELDNPEFSVKGRTGLRKLVRGILKGLNDVFPVELLYRAWKNTEGQLSFLDACLNHPDVFCLADYPYHSVVIDILKTPPEGEKGVVAVWKSLDLVEALLRLSETHYQRVSNIFYSPSKNCPDLLLLGLLQTSPTWKSMKQDLISSLIPIFLGNHPNSAAVLHYAWHCQGSNAIRTLIMHAMAEWYMRGEPHDQTRLARILDVAQDLKALSMLLNASPFAFVIDLACLASRREYLKLDKWLGDKILEHGEPFIQACATFLKRRCPQLLGGLAKDDPTPQSKSQQLPMETISIMVACLQLCTTSGQIPHELAEAIRTMVNNASLLLNKARQAQPAASVTPKPVNPGFPQTLTLPTTPEVKANDPMLQQWSTWQADKKKLDGGGILGQVGLGTSSTVSSSFPQGLMNVNPAPPSPSKAFPGLQPQSGGNAFNSMQSITSHFHNLGLQSSLPTSLPSMMQQQQQQGARNTVTSLGTLSVQTALKNPPGAAPGPAGRASRQAGNSSGDMSNFLPEMKQTFSKEVEDEANAYFQRIYNHPPHPTMSTDDVLDMLKRFKDSPNKKERDVYSCMLRSLLEEYRFFPQYPEKELHTTAVLFGGIIEQGLVTYMALGIALRYVLEALRKPVNSRMYFFGIAALDRFKSRLKDYPQYCTHLSSIPHFNQFQPHLIEYVQYGVQSQEPPHQPQGPITTRSLTPTGGLAGLQSSLGMPPLPPTPTSSGTPMEGVTTGTATPTSGATPVTPSEASSASPAAAAKPAITKPSIANATNIDTLLAGQGKEEISVPPEALQDKVFFIFNNLSLANMSQKAEELKEYITEEYMPWVSQYLVMKRASIEPNFHTLYANFIDALMMPNISLNVTKETFRNIKVLLRSDKGVANFSDRALLKNLGHWLGMLTLAKNKPILQIDIDLKTLLYEAYHKGAQELLYVVPFTAKVLESCAKSKVFKPPNPWTMAIMNVLSELHQEQNLKLNLKFEIEVLCKTLNIDLHDLKPGNYLKDPQRLSILEPQLSGAMHIHSPLPDLDPVSAVSTPPPVPVTVPGTTSTSTPSVSMPPQPQFGFSDISTSSLAGLVPHIIISDHPLWQASPQLKQSVRAAVERSVQELLPPVVERAIKIALNTCEQIVKKDFALDPEESRMRAAAHHMVRNMTAGLALITCREPLFTCIQNNLKTTFTSALRGLTQPQKDMVEQAAQLVGQENVELACAFIQKTAVERAIPEMDKRLATEFELRKHARNEGRRYCDPVVLTYQAERMPEQIRLKVGGVTPQQIAVYEEFARNIPGFQPSMADSSLPSGIARPRPVRDQPSPQSFVSNDIAQIFEKIAGDIKQYLQMAAMTPGNPQFAQLHGLIDSLLLARGTKDSVHALALLQKAVEGLLDHVTGMASESELRFRDCHLLVLKGLQDTRTYGQAWTNKNVTRVLLESRDERKYNIEAVECLIRSDLISMPMFDLRLASLMDNGMNYMAIAFAMQLLQRLCVDDKLNCQITDADFYNTIEALSRCAAHSRQVPEGLTSLIETIRQNSDGGLLDRPQSQSGPSVMMQSGISQAREFDDPPGLHEKTEYLLREWVNMYHQPAAGRDSTKAFSAFVSQMHQQGILKTDDLISRFFRLCTEMCVDLCYRALGEQNQSPALVRAKCFHTLDAFVRLIALLVKYSGDNANTVTKINLLNKVLGIVAGVLYSDHEMRLTEFQQLPYHRIFIMLFIELNAPEPILDTINLQVLTAFCNTFHMLRPAKAPGFVYAWLELVSHRVFIGRLLALTSFQRGWGMYAQLLIDLFKYLSPFLRNGELSKPTQLLYKGTSRVLLVLLHDFPEFLGDFHYAFCDVIPPNCVQMRNLVLSAFPRYMRLPDPFSTPNLKVDMLSDIAQAPRILTNVVSKIQPPSFRKNLDSYLQMRSPVVFLSELRSNLQSDEPGMRYNIPLMNALVLYVGTQAISYIHSKGLSPSMSTIAHSSHMDIFQSLGVSLDTEGRYLFLNAIANQLRYPNSHTHYFSCTLLYLFAETNTTTMQEQITRVLLDRLIVNRPHPWGLIITFIELVKNPQFKFWSHDFVHCAYEIEKLFESALSCMQNKQMAPAMEPETAEIH